MTILEAMTDENLFGRWFAGSSWDAAKVFLAVLFGLALTGEQLAAFRRFTGRSDSPTGGFLEGWLCCGRRAGKSLIAALIAVYLALFRDYSKFLAPGEIATICIVAADRRQARTILRYVRGFVNEVPMLAKMVESEMKESITFTNRTAIEIHTSSFRTIRGYTMAACLNDELAFWEGDEDSAEPAAEVLAAERPALATIPGALLLSLSSPHARRGPLYAAYQKYFAKDSAPALFWKADSKSMNPNLPDSVIAEAYERDPIAADAEYGANFRKDCEEFISREVLDRCVVKDMLESPRQAGVKYFAFVDPSGGSSDSMTLAIAHLNAGRPMLDCIRETRPPFNPSMVVGEFAALLRTYGVSEVTGDAYSGEWVRESFRTAGIQYRVSARTRSEIYLELLPLLNSKQVLLLDVPRLLVQLAALERRASRSGSESIDHAPGAHDDMANAAAGAIVLANTEGSKSSCGGFVSTPRRRIWKF